MKRPAIIENSPCVYMIKNTVNGKVYIGSSVRPCGRFYSHVNRLKKGYHHSIRLQRSFNKYGAEAFIFIVLKYTEKNEHRKEEARIIKMLDAINPEKGYNCSDLTDYGSVKHTEETIQKMRKATKHRCRPVLCSNNMRFDSLRDAGRYFGVGHSDILHLIKKQRPGRVSNCGRRSKLKGLSFKYEEETENVG